MKALFKFMTLQTGLGTTLLGSHCVKSVQIRSFSGPYFPVFGLITEVYGVNLCIQSEYGKIRSRKNIFGHFLRSELHILLTHLPKATSYLKRKTINHRQI